MGLWTRCGVGVLGVIILGCSQHYEEGAKPPPMPPPQTQMPAGHPAVDGQETAMTASETATTQAVFSGTIRIADDLVGRVPKQGVLFLIVRPAPTGGPPLMVKRIPMPTFPYQYSLTETDGMMPGQKVDLEEVGGLYIVARLDVDGSIGPFASGDMEGACVNNPAALGAQDADILIDTVH